MQAPLENETSPAIFRVGDVLGETFEIRGLLGEGAMGQVFEAFDRKLARRVAIKANWPEVEQSVRTEAQALAALRHPGVVAVYALASHGDVEFMVMEHVSGVTLAEHLGRLEAWGLPLFERVELLLAIADGLTAIHRAGLSHGDLKPENVLLSTSGRVVLTDLGLVRAAYEPGDGGAVSGTPAYMAPEIVTPAIGFAGWSLVDEYAFGVLAYRVVAGRPPYESEDPLELLMMHARAEVPALDGVPERLNALVRWLLAKEPTERPPTMEAVLWELRAARDEIARAQTVEIRPEARSTGAPAPPSVLVVDDDREIGRLVARYVKQAVPFADVTVAGSAAEALEACRLRRPRLVFLDLMMPHMSGFELFTYLRGVQLVDAASIVVMSAGGSRPDIEVLLELGAQEFVDKGRDLRARVARLAAAHCGNTDPKPEKPGHKA